MAKLLLVSRLPPLQAYTHTYVLLDLYKSFPGQRILSTWHRGKEDMEDWISKPLYPDHGYNSKVRLAHSAFESISLHHLRSAHGFALLHILANICCLSFWLHSSQQMWDDISLWFYWHFPVINLHSHIQINIICNSKDVETCKQPRYQWKSESCSVESDSLWPHRLYSPWISPDQNTGVGSLSLLQGIFPTQGLNPISLHCRQFFTSWATREAQEYWNGYPILLQWIFLTQESNWGLIHCRCILYQLSYQGSPI